MQRLPLRRNAAEEGGCLIKRKPNKKKKKERRKAKRRKGRRKQRVNRGRKGGWIREPLAGWDSIPRNGRIWLANSRKRKPTGVAGGGWNHVCVRVSWRGGCKWDYANIPHFKRRSFRPSAPRRIDNWQNWYSGATCAASGQRETEPPFPPH